MGFVNVAIAACALVAAAQTADPRTTPPGPNAQYISGLLAGWRPALVGAFAAFEEERNPVPDCFSIYAFDRGDALLVEFVAGRPLPEDAHLRGGRTSCGRSVSFLMSRRGTLLRTTYSR